MLTFFLLLALVVPRQGKLFKIKNDQHVFPFRSFQYI